jgi:peptidoglycan hydrolase CwlO-like protein
MSVYEQVKQALQDVVAPELKSIQVEIRRLDNRIDSLKSEITTEIKRLDSKIDSLDNKIDIAIQIRERLASLEAKLAAMGHS